MDTRELIHSILDQHGDNTLAHYASPYYDPVKAKEYYERTKQLKGRQPATSSSQREAIGYAKNQIKTAKTKELQSLAARREARLKESAERIKSRLDKLIQQRADAILKRLERLPEDASPELVSKLMKTNSKNVNKARAQASKELASTVSGIRKSFAKARDEINKKYSKAQATEEANIRANVR